MSRQIIPFAEFNRRAKRLLKKYRSLPTELRKLSDSLAATPIQGQSLGAGLYKIRLGSASKGGGKSGGFRVITYYVEQTTDGEIIYLVTIYDKSEAANDQRGTAEAAATGITLLKNECPSHLAKQMRKA